MDQNARKFLTLVAVGVVLFTIMVTDTHRTAIATVWPSLTAFTAWLGLPVH